MHPSDVFLKLLLITDKDFNGIIGDCIYFVSYEYEYFVAENEYLVE